MKSKINAYLTIGTGGLFLFLTGCETAPRGESEWRKPPRYGAGGDERDNRFGYTGEEGNRGPSSERNTFGNRNEREAPGPNREKKEPSAPPSVENMGFAIKVPGKPLSVTLPGSGRALGEISIEKYDASGNPTGEPLPPGTPVEIDDPNNPGKKIYFKVP